MRARMFAGEIRGNPLEVALHKEHFQVRVNGQLVADYRYRDEYDPRVLISLPNGQGGLYCTEVRVEPLGPTALLISHIPAAWRCVCEYPENERWVRIDMKPLRSRAVVRNEASGAARVETQVPMASGRATECDTGRRA